MAYQLWTDSPAAVPIVYLHSFSDNGKAVWDACKALRCPAFHLVSIHGIDLDAALTPWPAEGVRRGQPPFGGKAAAHLASLLSTTVPEVERQLPAPPSYSAIAGYSLAGLFAYWSLCQSPFFRRCACVSASFWYPRFVDYARSQPLPGPPECVYFSLGDKESQTRHPLMRHVGEATAALFHHVREQGVGTCFETNPGHHFSEPDRRMARAISWLLRQ